MNIRGWHKWRSGGLTFYRAWNLDRTGLVTHCFSTRRGGVSESPYESLNLGLHVGDNSEYVLENRRRCCDALGLDIDKLTTAEQVHGSAVAVVGAGAEAIPGGICHIYGKTPPQPSPKGEGASPPSFRRGLGGGRCFRRFDIHPIPDVDALITNTPGIPLALFFADCVPVFIVDPINRAIGLAHAGWKGTAAGIATETLKAMAREFGTKAEDCQTAIGPAIGRCCYEVGPEVAEAVWKTCSDQRVLARGSAGKFKADLQVANWCLLRAAGVPEDNIAMCLRCTSCHQEDFFSYRRDGETGRMGAFLALK